MDQNLISKAGNLLSGAKNTLVVMGQNPSIDTAAAALSLYLSLRQAGRNVAIACSTPMTAGLNRLIGIDKVTDSPGGQNLVISFPYVQDSIEKVSYHIKGDKFNLVIQPKEGFETLDSGKVEYNYSGTSADVIAIIGSAKLEALGSLWEDEKKVFENAQTINIDISPVNSKFGKTNIVETPASSISEVIALFMENLNMPVNADIATNLMSGIEANTQNLTSRTRAETFQAVAYIMKNGARRGQMQSVPAAQPFDASPYASGFGVRQPIQQPIQQPQQMPTWAPQPPAQPQQPETVAQPQPDQQQSPSPDWLKPKIYQGSTKVQ